MHYLKNFWVQKRYKRVIDNEWMLFLWGFPSLTLVSALEAAAKKDKSALEIRKETETCLEAYDAVAETYYIVEMRDDKPEIPENPNTSVRDQTLPKRVERKAMPVPGSLFKSSQMKLF